MSQSRILRFRDLNGGRGFSFKKTVKTRVPISCPPPVVDFPLKRENYSIDFEIVRLNYLRIVNYAAGRSEFHLI